MDINKIVNTIQRGIYNAQTWHMYLYYGMAAEKKYSSILSGVKGWHCVCGCHAALFLPLILVLYFSE